MPVIDLECTRCGVESELVPSLSSRPDCPRCGRPRRKVISQVRTVIPSWMSDENIDANANHRRWMRSQEGKAQLDSMPLVAAGDNDE